jgi:hypothetical protein
MVKKLIIGGVAVAAVTVMTACSSTASTVTVPASPSVSATQSGGIGVHPGTFVSQFREQFPSLAAGKSDQQILSDGEADCSDMAAAGKITTTAMAARYGLGNSAADQFTLNNIGLLAMFTLCGVR